MKNLLGRIRLFKKKINKEDDQNASSQTIEKDEKSYAIEIEKLQKRVEEVINLSDDETVLIKSINGHITTHSDIYASIGYFQGKKSARDYNILKTATAQATLIAEHVNSLFKGKIKGLEFSINERQSHLKSLKENSVQNMGEMKEKSSEKNNDFKKFDRWLAYIYISFAIAMILADIAVSINLVGYFGIGHVKVSSTFLDRILDPELLLFSLGIAFCTIYVKIMYDEYINGRLGSSYEEINKAIGKGVSKLAIYSEIVIKVAVKVLILVGLLFLLYNLAKYRTYFTLFNFTISQQLSQIRNVYLDVNNVMLNSYVGITVIVPVISGISLSMGLKILAHRKTLSNSTAYQKELNKEILETEDKLKEMTSRNAQFEFHLQEWSKIDHKIRVISGLFVQRYNQGFRMGYRENSGNDMYTIVEEYRNEFINKKLSDYIN